MIIPSMKLLPAITLLLVLATDTKAKAEWKPAAMPLRTKWAAALATLCRIHVTVGPRALAKPQRSLEVRHCQARCWKAEPMAGRNPCSLCHRQALSGVRKPLESAEHLWYERMFEVPADWKGKRLQLHFEAVDWQSKVWVNGKEVGEHEGGYTPFTFDISTTVQPGDNTLTVRVFDPTEKSAQPLGKQSRGNFSDARGIRYTSTSGTRQTVWLDAAGNGSEGGSVHAGCGQQRREGARTSVDRRRRSRCRLETTRCSNPAWSRRSRCPSRAFGRRPIRSFTT